MHSRAPLAAGSKTREDLQGQGSPHTNSAAKAFQLTVKAFDASTHLGRILPSGKEGSFKVQYSSIDFGDGSFSNDFAHVPSKFKNR